MIQIHTTSSNNSNFYIYFCARDSQRETTGRPLLLLYYVHFMHIENEMNAFQLNADSRKFPLKRFCVLSYDKIENHSGFRVHNTPFSHLVILCCRV